VWAVLARRLSVWSLVVLYASFFSLVTILRHETFHSTTFDLVITDQALWNTLHGSLLGLTLEPDATLSDLGYHSELILLPIAPLYWLMPNVDVILVLQSALLSLGALPASWLAYARLRSNLAAVVFALAYLLFPALQSANVFDFHAFTLVAPFLLFAFYYLDQRRYLAFAIAAGLAMSTRENVPLTIGLMGLYMLVVQRAWRPGLATMGAAGAWFALGTYVIVPAFNLHGQAWLWNRYAGMGGGAWQVIAFLFAHPERLLQAAPGLDNVQYLQQLLFPLGYLSLLHPASLLLLGPGLATNLLTDYGAMHLIENYHYAAGLVPLVVVSAVCGAGVLAGLAGRLGEWPRRVAVWAVCALVLGSSLAYHYYHGYTPLSPSFSLAWPGYHEEVGRRLAASIPPEAAVSAQFNLGPHVSQRAQFSMFPAVGNSDYIFLDVATQPNSVGFWEGFHNRVKEALARPDYGLVAAEDGFILLKKGAPRRELPDEFFSFARARQAAPQHPLRLRFGDSLELLGFDVQTGRDAKADLTLYWQSLKPLNQDLSLFVYFTDGRGKELGATGQLQPANYWYPTSRWRVGETVKVQTLELPWDPRNEDFALGVAASTGRDPWDVGKRLPVSVEEAAWQIGALANGTIAEIVSFRNDRGLLTPWLPDRSQPRAAEAKPLATFGQLAALVSYEVSPQPALPGNETRVRLVWRVLNHPGAAYTTFVHALAPGPKVVAQKDSPPLGGRFPTTFWLPGDELADEYTMVLPGDLARGQYEIEIGLYDPTTGKRLPVTLADGTTLDHFLLPNRLTVSGK
jgi:uncharacterized membrane protein